MSTETDRKDCYLGLKELLSPEFFKALADPNRLHILSHLINSRRPHTVSEVSNCCPVDLSVVSRHLKSLRDAGILEARKNGKEVMYRVRVSDLAERLRGLADALEACCPHGECTFTDGENNELL